VPKERDDPVLAGAVLAGAPLPLRPVLLAVHKPSLLEQQLHRRLGCCVRLGPADGPVAAPPPAVPVHRLAHRTHLDRPNQHEEVARACCACSLRRGTRSRGGRMAVPPEVLAQWSKYEDIAMHFNTLIIQFRLQAVGGMAALATLALVSSEKVTRTMVR